MRKSAITGSKHLGEKFNLVRHSAEYLTADSLHVLMQAVCRFHVHRGLREYIIAYYTQALFAGSFAVISKKDAAHINQMYRQQFSCK